jgi:hypothetical protein
MNSRSEEGKEFMMKNVTVRYERRKVKSVDKWKNVSKCRAE